MNENLEINVEGRRISKLILYDHFPEKKLRRINLVLTFI